MPKAPPFTLYPIGQLAAKAQSIEWVVDGLIASGSLLLFTGRAKIARKSLTALHLAKCVSSGAPFLSRQVLRRRAVVYSVIEDGEARIARRAKLMGLCGEKWDSLGDPNKYQFAALIGIDEHLAFYETALKEPNKAKNLLWIIDPLAQVAAASKADENSASEMTNLLVGYQELAQRTNSTIVIVHHMRKDGDRLRGSSALEAATDGWVEATGDPISDVITQDWILRDARSQRIGVRIAFDDERKLYTFETADAPPPKERGRKSAKNNENVIFEIREAICEVLLDAETADVETDPDFGLSRGEILARIANEVDTKPSDRTVGRALSDLVESKTVTVLGKSRKTRYRISEEQRRL